MNKDVLIKAGIAGVVVLGYVGGYLYANSVANDEADTQIRQLLIKGQNYSSEITNKIISKTSYDAGVSLGFTPQIKSLNVNDQIVSDSITIHNIDKSTGSYHISFENLSISQDYSYRDISSKIHDIIYKLGLSGNVKNLSGDINISPDHSLITVSDEHGSELSLETDFNIAKSSNIDNFLRGEANVSYSSNGSYELIDQLMFRSISYDIKDHLRKVKILKIDDITVSTNGDDEEGSFEISIDGEGISIQASGLIPHNYKNKKDTEINVSLNLEQNKEASEQLMAQVPYEFRQFVRTIVPNEVELEFNLDGDEGNWSLEATTEELEIATSGSASGKSVDASISITNDSGNEIYQKLGLKGLIDNQLSTMKIFLKSEEELKNFEASKDADIVKAIANDNDADDALEKIIAFIENPKSIKISVDGDIKDLESIQSGRSIDLDKFNDLIDITLN